MRKAFSVGVALAAVAACSGSSSSSAVGGPGASLDSLGYSATIDGRFMAVGGPAGATPSPQRGRIEIRSSGQLVGTMRVRHDGYFHATLKPGTYSLVGYSPQYARGRASCNSYPPSLTVQAGRTKHIDVLWQRR